MKKGGINVPVKFFYTAIFSILVLLPAINVFANDETDNCFSEKEYSIYSIILNENYIRPKNLGTYDGSPLPACRLIVIEDKSIKSAFEMPANAGDYALLKERMPGIREDTFNNYLIKNNSQCNFTRRFNIKTDYAIIGEAEYGKIHEDIKVYKTFLEKYLKPRMFYVDFSVFDNMSYHYVVDPYIPEKFNVCYPLGPEFINYDKNSCDLQNEIELIPENNLTSRYFWKFYYANFPKSYGTVSFSRIGFNKEMNQCLVYVDFWCGDLCAEGCCYMLVKENNVWKIKYRISRYVS